MAKILEAAALAIVAFALLVSLYKEHRLSLLLGM
jgi:hypothetical protein